MTKFTAYHILVTIIFEIPRLIEINVKGNILITSYNYILDVNYA